MNRNLIMLGVPSWDGLWTRQNHFAIRFVNSDINVFYIEEHKSFISMIKGFDFKKLFFIKKRKGVTVIRLLPSIIGHNNNPYLLKLLSIYQLIQLKIILLFYGIKEFDLWLRLYYYYLAKYLKSNKIYYDITDNYSEYSSKKGDTLPKS